MPRLTTSRSDELRSCRALGRPPIHSHGRFVPVTPPGFCNRGEVRYGSIGGLEYEVPQSRLYCLCIDVALCSTALQCICRVIRRSSMTMKAHTYYITFGRPPIGGKLPPPYPLAAPLLRTPLLFSGLRRFVWRCQSRVELVRRDWLCEY